MLERARLSSAAVAGFRDFGETGVRLGFRGRTERCRWR